MPDFYKSVFSFDIGVSDETFQRKMYLEISIYPGVVQDIGSHREVVVPDVLDHSRASRKSDRHVSYWTFRLSTSPGQFDWK